MEDCSRGVWREPRGVGSGFRVEGLGLKSRVPVPVSVDSVKNCKASYTYSLHCSSLFMV